MELLEIKISNVKVLQSNRNSDINYIRKGENKEMETQKTCTELVKENFDARMEDLHILWDLYCNDPEASDENLGNMYDYGLSFDYVAPETFGEEQEEGYFRYQLSWGGPSDEFRIYAQKIKDYRYSVYKIEYWYLDWFDGARWPLHGKDKEFIEEVFTSFFVDSGSADAELEKALEEM